MEVDALNWENPSNTFACHLISESSHEDRHLVVFPGIGSVFIRG